MRLLLLSILILLTTSACKKKRLPNYADYHPEIEMVSIEALPDGSVVVSAKVLKDGPRPIQAAGFGFSENPIFNIAENQRFAFVGNAEFYAIYPTEMFQESTTYYFKAFVITEFGYRETDVLSISNIEITPIEPPCTHPQNKYRFFSSPPFYDIIPDNNVDEYSTKIEYRSSIMPTGTLSITFRNAPVTGIYNIVQTDNLGAFDTRIQIMSAQSSSAMIGGKVYVNKISDAQFRVVACEIPWSLNTSTQTVFDMNWLLNY